MKMEKENSSDFDVELFDLMPINGKKKLIFWESFCWMWLERGQGYWVKFGLIGSILKI